MAGWKDDRKVGIVKRAHMTAVTSEQKQNEKSSTRTNDRDWEMDAA